MNVNQTEIIIFFFYLRHDITQLFYRQLKRALLSIYLFIYLIICLFIYLFTFLQAKDSDTGNNSRISYELMPTKDSGEFSIDRETGWIQAKASYAGKNGEEFVIDIIAKDNFGEKPYFNDTAEVKVGLYNTHI